MLGISRQKSFKMILAITKSLCFKLTMLWHTSTSFKMKSRVHFGPEQVWNFSQVHQIMKVIPKHNWYAPVTKVRINLLLGAFSDISTRKKFYKMMQLKVGLYGQMDRPQNLKIDSWENSLPMFFRILESPFYGNSVQYHMVKGYATE